MQAGKRKITQKMLLILVMAGVLMISAVAWFALANRSRSGDLEIEMPPIIYIKGRQSAGDDLLRSGRPARSTRPITPCSAWLRPMRAVKDFDLGVIYTENIGMVINLYPVQNITEKPESAEYEKRTLEGQDCYFNYTTSDASWKATVSYTKERNPDATYQQTHLNRGVYKTYSDEFKDYTAEGRDIYAKLNDTEAYRFYVLQVTWKENISEAELEKETDVVYIVTQGGTKRGA
ncbi:MAG: hypothetical protein ACLUNQ_00185 [Oscillospiraceae bacterium]